MSSIQIYNDVLNQGPSLTELAANAVVQRSKACPWYKSSLSFDTKNRIHTQWVNLKKFSRKFWYIAIHAYERTTCCGLLERSRLF